MDDQERELLRQRVAFLEQTVERCMEEIAALQTRVAMLEARPVAIAPSEIERAAPVTIEIESARKLRPAESLAANFDTPHGSVVWENDRRERKPR